MNNNRGQALVLFVVIIPMFLLVMYVLINIGRMAFFRNELDSINYIAIDYGLDNLEEEDLIDKLKEIINKNDSSITNISIDCGENQLIIELEDNYKLLLFNTKSIFKVKSSMIGKIENDKKLIERNK